MGVWYCSTHVSVFTYMRCKCMHRINCAPHTWYSNRYTFGNRSESWIPLQTAVKQLQQKRRIFPDKLGEYHLKVSAVVLAPRSRWWFDQLICMSERAAVGDMRSGTGQQPHRRVQHSDVITINIYNVLYKMLSRRMRMRALTLAHTHTCFVIISHQKRRT